MTDEAPVQTEHADPQTILGRMGDGFLALDGSWRITYANAEGQEILRASTSDTIDDIEGRNLWDSIPESRDTIFFEKFTEAMAAQEPVAFETHYRLVDAWFEVRAFPSESGLSVYFRDISDYKELAQERQDSLYALQQLYSISSDGSKDLATKANELLALGCEYLDLRNGFMTRIEQGEQYVVHSAATHPEVQEGSSCPLSEAYCKRTIELDELMTVVNASDEGWRDDPAYDRFEFETYIGGRLSVDGEFYGTLCFADTSPQRDGFTDTQRTFVELLTRWLGYELERNQAAEQLKRERDRLDDFAQVVSHDLRNPLNTATGRVELLREDTDSEHLPPIERSLDKMEQLIDDLLTLARDGQKVKETSAVRLARTARTSWTVVETDGVEFTVTAEGTAVLADAERLQQVFENLFRNASEHGETVAEVEVGVLDDEPGFYVADDGVGIPTGEREQVFEPGYTTQNDGTGFGLNIVEDIVSAHDWHIDVTESAAGGARFEISGVEFVDGSQ
ncbi:ATP-binding protein [Haloarcula litorea]|uniref:PAS domain-containing sensor histidine kinase n=1 Tax=Haloarcula litorea TaxID=3032579 RepID=UPI0023E86592|nr:ATP-binding protein [Halomicroarcula sp. GDY20]